MYSPLKRPLLLLALALLALLLPAPAAADDAVNVQLRYFRGTPQDNRVWLEWETQSELNTAAYIIERSEESADGPWLYLSEIGQIPATGGPTFGDYYQAYDETAVNGETYWYRLVEIEESNNQVPLQVIEITLDDPGGGIPTPGDGPGATVPPGATSTDVPTGTPPPSTTPTPTNTRTPAPTVAGGSPAPTSEPVTPTWTPRPPGPTPTAFRFPTGTPQADGSGFGSVEVAEGAALPPAQDYPGPGTITPLPDPAYPAAPQNGITPLPTTNFGSPNGNLDPAVPGATAEAAPGEQQEPLSPARGRILLWLGFAGGLLILAGGIFLSITLTTRRR